MGNKLSTSYKVVFSPQSCLIALYLSDLLCFKNSDREISNYKRLKVIKI